MAYAMLDGFKVGTEVDENLAAETSGIDVPADTVKPLWDALKACGTVLKTRPGTELSVGIDLLHKKWNVSLRKDGRGSAWYLNISGNARVSNEYGSLTPVRDVLSTFNALFKKLRKHWSVPEEMETRVRRGQIHLHSVTFAVYTVPMEKAQMKRLFSLWYMLYETRVENNGMYESLLSLLGLKRLTGEQYDYGLSLALTSKNGQARRTLVKCVAYNKAIECAQAGKQLGVQTQRDLEKRIRVDLTITNYYMRNQWRIKPMLRDLVDLARRRGGWRELVAEVWSHWLRKSCMSYAFSCPNPFVVPALRSWVTSGAADVRTETTAEKLGLNLKIGVAAHRCILWSRWLMTLSEQDVSKYISGDARSMEKKLRHFNDKPGVLRLALEAK